MLIAFEGLDGSGKTELSVSFCQYLNERWEGTRPIKGGKGFDGFVWTKQPSMTSDEACSLNDPKEDLDPFKREALFLASRLKQVLKGNVVCDRYIWSALAYAKVHSPGIFQFLVEVYVKNDLFIRPDFYVFVDTDISCCSKRSKKDEQLLTALYRSYQETKELIGDVPILDVKSNNIDGLSNSESIEIALKSLIDQFNSRYTV